MDRLVGSARDDVPFDLKQYRADRLAFNIKVPREQFEHAEHLLGLSCGAMMSYSNRSARCCFKLNRERDLGQTHSCLRACN